MKYEEEENKNKKLVILIFLLLILIFLCLYLITFGKITFGKTTDNNELIPTGNVDIFDININCTKCPTCESNEITVFKEVDGQLDNVIVYDKNGLIDDQVNLRIFNRATYKYNDKIAPGMYNSYQFIVRNNNSFDITYDFKMTETNIYNINMKYRLLRNDTYVIGDNDTWVRASDLKLNNIDLATIDYDTYTLDWKWFDNDNDTYIGENAKEDYRLDINLIASKKDES